VDSFELSRDFHFGEERLCSRLGVLKGRAATNAAIIVGIGPRLDQGEGPSLCNLVARGSLCTPGAHDPGCTRRPNRMQPRCRSCRKYRRMPCSNHGQRAMWSPRRGGCNESYATMRFLLFLSETGVRPSELSLHLLISTISRHQTYQRLKTEACAG